MSGKRSFQFGLRKLLLWTTAVAIYLGILRMFGVDPSTSILLTSWVMIVGIVRAVFSARRAAVASAVIGALLAASLACLSSRWSSLTLFDFLSYVVLVQAFGLFGLFVYAFVEVAFRAVNWTDSVLETKADGEARRD